MEPGALVSLFAVELDAAHEAWRRAPPEPRGAEPAAARFDAFIEERAAAHLFDAPFAVLAGALDSIARAAKLRGLDIAGIEGGRSAYPAGLSPKGGAGLVVWLDAVEPEAAQAARGDLGAAPRGVDPDLWRDLVDALAPLLDAAARPGVVVVGHLG